MLVSANILKGKNLFVSFFLLTKKGVERIRVIIYQHQKVYTHLLKTKSINCDIMFCVIEHRTLERRYILIGLVDQTKNIKIQLGELIRKIRTSNNMSQRELARKINLSNSNLKYIEDGVNAPTPEVYRRLVEIISPSDEELKLLDKLYSDVRGAPPLEVCNFLIKNSDLYSVIRNNNFKLSKDQIAKISSIISKEDKIKEL